MQEIEFSPEDQVRIQEAWQRTMGFLTKLYDSGVPMTGDEVYAVFDEHQAWIEQYWGVTMESYVELGTFYAEYPDSRARFEAQSRGLAAYVSGAIAAYGRARLPR